ncbi:amidohydrolase [Sediminicoccus sp. KRV36]|uniref:amidohydrolase n=1 Tax=Sediminicoccus sp. KRV36 TaxID=3133721 RepID=UPI00200ECC16|nr:amidohydrolase [Sediminicoccus rosea]UPY35001.1 amidohydrolase [Sediminicoccus rosea]
MNADIIFTGGSVFRGLTGGMAEALAVAGGKVMAVGSRAEMEALSGAGTRRVDLAGRLAIPAFHEAHMHLLPFGLGLSMVNLRAEEVRSLEETRRRLRAAAAATPKGQWVMGWGYDHAALDIGRHPTVTELDAAVPDHPLLIMRTCGHMGVANSAALRAAGIGHNTPDPEGGVIERRGGALTGLIQERALSLIKAAMPEPDEARMVDAIEAAGRRLASLGFASATDMNVGMTAGMAEVAAYERAVRDGRCLQRMWQVLAGNPEGIADAAWEAGMRPWRPDLGQGGDDLDAALRWGAVKVFADGSAGGLTAAFFDPYVQGGTGVFTFPTETIHALLEKYHGQGWQLDIHAIGDAAIEQVLTGMEAADATPERRHRIEHCGFVTRDQMRRMKARGILPVPQPVFMYEFGDLYLRNLGQARTETAYPMKTWLEQGHHPAASSDSPVSTVDPFPNLLTMVTRRTNQGTVFGPEERLSIQEALHCYTWCGAHSNFAESRRGTLEPGMDADIAILSQDITALAPEEYLGVQCDATLRGGIAIHDRHDEFRRGEFA